MGITGRGLDHIEPRFRTALDRIADRALVELGLVVSVNSGARPSCCGAGPPASQQWLYDHQHLPGFAPANRPGTSLHEYGGTTGREWAMAADLSPSDAAERPALRRICEEEGCWFRYPHEDWHLEPNTTRGIPMPDLTYPVGYVKPTSYPPEDPPMPRMIRNPEPPNEIAVWALDGDWGKLRVIESEDTVHDYELMYGAAQDVHPVVFARTHRGPNIP